MNLKKSVYIPICSFCNKIRVDDEWGQDSNHPDYDSHEYTHGLCPECVAKHYPDYVEKVTPKIS